MKHFKINTYWHKLFRPMPKAWFTLTTKCNAKLKIWTILHQLQRVLTLKSQIAHAILTVKSTVNQKCHPHYNVVLVDTIHSG